MTRIEPYRRINPIYYQGLNGRVTSISKVRTKEEKLSGNNYTTKYNIPEKKNASRR